MVVCISSHIAHRSVHSLCVHLGGLCSVVHELALAAVHDIVHHVHHSLHEGLEHIAVEALDWLDERLERLSETALETKS